MGNATTKNVCNNYENCIRTCASTGTPCSRTRRVCFSRLVAFVGGCALGQLYYIYLLKKIPFPPHISALLSLGVSLLLGVGNLVCAQLRCICLLTLPMYCGKPGRGVLKAVVLTYVIAAQFATKLSLPKCILFVSSPKGPITNMGFNAKEVVRVFACSTQLSHNLSRLQYYAVSDPFKKALFDMRTEVSQVKDTVRSFRDVVIPIELEIEGENLICQNQKRNNNISRSYQPNKQENKDGTKPDISKKHDYQNKYLRKLKSRCENLWSRATAFCMGVLASAPERCRDPEKNYSSWVLCWPTALNAICDLKQTFGQDICDSSKHTNPGLGEGYAQLKEAKNILTDNKDVSLQYKINTVRELYDVQDAKETGDRVMHAFEEKYIIMHMVTIIVDVCVALLFLRIFTAAVSYHDQYLTNIEHDNVYVTSYFKKIDARRKRRDKYTLLPLKKMERSKYIDVHSFRYKSSERDKLVTHILKVTLEVVTATTFVMLDRLFYEALDVVRQHAETESTNDGTRDLEIQVEGTGTLAGMVRKLLDSLNNVDKRGRRSVVNKQCLPRPRLMAPVYYLMIYGGYLWILLLLYINPYTVRLKRLVCSYFYPRREKQRILHLYNDILKKRIKMQKTLQRKAIQAVRAHYLSGENLLSLRMKFPRLLGWLQVFPAARMTCLICGETAPRDTQNLRSEEYWYHCSMAKCPFVYCMDCWQEVGARCLACDPSLADLSDVDSLSEDEFIG